MSISSINQAECTFYLYTITSFLLLLTFYSIYTPTYPLTHPPSPLSTFHPLKDPSTPPYTHPNKTWFISTLSGRRIADGMPEHFLLPSPTHPHTLCISPQNKSYTLANHTTSTSTSSSSSGGGVVVLSGLTFMADSYYDYENPWHGLNAMAPFFAWMREREREGKCEERPRRWVLFKRGELVRGVGKWVESLVSVGLDGEDHVKLDGLKGYDHEKVVVCFERVLMMRRGLGGMSGRRRNELFEMLRCKAWKKCTDHDHEKESGRVRVSLVGREKKKRGFKNETGVKEVMEGVCRGEEGGCDVSTYHLDSNMSFCNQVLTKNL